MAISDLLWACPLCRTTGSVRYARRGFFRRRDECAVCDAVFTRGDGATIVAMRDGGSRIVRPAAEWERILGPVTVPEPDDDGRILGPHRVAIRRAAGQRPLRFGSELLGWVESYTADHGGSLTLRPGTIEFQAEDGRASDVWPVAGITGIQPASSALQLAFGSDMVSVRFREGALRLWTRALAEQVVAHHAAAGRDVVEFQPRVRFAARRRAGSQTAADA